MERKSSRKNCDNDAPFWPNFSKKEYECGFADFWVIWLDIGDLKH